MELHEVLRNHLAKKDLRTNAEQFLAGILRDEAAGEITDDGTYTYDDSTGSAEKFMVSGNGPTAYVVFVEFAIDDVTGYLEYADSDGTTITYIPDILVKSLRDSLRADAKGRNAR
jgi:hypothetical protein